MKGGTKTEIRVALVDDHRLVLEALALLINGMKGITCAWTSEDPVEAVHLLDRDTPDVLITDITMPTRNGLELIKDVKMLKKGRPRLVLSMHPEAVYAQRAIKAGAKGYVMKGGPREELEGAIRKVADGGIAVSEELGEKMIAAYTGGGDIHIGQGVAMLSDREFEVFQLVGNCRNTSQVAEELQISPKTVDVHKSKIRAKLELAKGESLTAYAIRWVEVQRLHPGAER